jgi:hypothetical protein
MRHDPQSYRLPVGYHDLGVIAPRARTRRRLTAKRGNQPVTGNPEGAQAAGALLLHCRCVDCTKYSFTNGEHLCAEGIGGVGVVWATGRVVCDPSPEAWHYCAGYEGPQISDDVWVWPKVPPTSRHVGPGSTIAADPANPTAVAEGRNRGEPVINGSFPATCAEDRARNGRALPFCLLRAEESPADGGHTQEDA